MREVWSNVPSQKWKKRNAVCWYWFHTTHDVDMTFRTGVKIFAEYVLVKSVQAHRKACLRGQPVLVRLYRAVASKCHGGTFGLYKGSFCPNTCRNEVNQCCLCLMVESLGLGKFFLRQWLCALIGSLIGECSWVQNIDCRIIRKG